MSVEALNAAPASTEENGLFARSGVLRRLVRDKVAMVAALLLATIGLAAIFAPLVAPYDPYLTDLTKVMQPPSAEHWFGTDNTGRDILSRVIFGARNTLMLGLVGVIVGGFLGGFLGILAAYYRRLDGWIMRLVDVMLAFPAILIGLAVAAIFGAGLDGRGDRAGGGDRAGRGARGARRGDRRHEPGIHGGRPRRRRLRPHADLALPDPQLHLDHLRVPDAALRPDHPDRLGAGLPRHGRPAADRRAWA